MHNKPVLKNTEPGGAAESSAAKRVVKQQPQCAELDDNILLNLIGDGRDRAALAELYNRYQLPVARFLQRQMSSTKLIEEVYNDVMLTVWEKAANFRGESKVSTWIFGIAYRTRLTHYRKESRHDHVGNEDLMVNITSEEQAEADTQAAVNDALHAALVELSESHRTVIELSYFHGYSTSEIADIVRIPQNTVKTRLFHARKKLKTTLEADQAGVVAEDKPQDSGSPLNARRKGLAQQTPVFSQHYALATS